MKQLLLPILIFYTLLMSFASLAYEGQPREIEFLLPLGTSIKGELAEIELNEKEYDSSLHINLNNNCPVKTELFYLYLNYPYHKPLNSKEAMFIGEERYHLYKIGACCTVDARSS